MIQIDMEMPKNCLDCTLRYQSFCSVDGHHEPHLEKERCPLKVTSQEPRKGHWEWLRCDMYVCSECKNVYTDLSGIKDGMNYCPNCGSRNEVEK